MDEKDFNRAYQAASRALEEEDATGHGSEFEGQRGKYVEKEESTTINNAVEQILSADAKKDYFRMLGLPYPDVDALGRPVWKVTPGDVSKAYRKFSILVHPDKNPDSKARDAFEALNKAHRKLKDPASLDQILRENLEDAVRRKEVSEAAAPLDEKVKMMNQKKQEEKELRKQEASSFQDEILQQMKEKQEKALKKKRLRERHDGMEEGSLFGSIDDDDGEKREASTAKYHDDNDDDEEEGNESIRRRRRQAMARRSMKKALT